MAQKLYVGNLPFSATQDEVLALFAEHGTVISVNLVTDKDSGRPRGFGFVEIQNGDAAIAALNDYEFDGRSLNVSIAKERSSRDR